MSQKVPIITDLKEGQSVSAPFIIDNVCPKTTKQGDPFFFAELKNASGKISAVCWEPDGCVTPAQNGEIVFIVGTVGSYNGQPQLRIESVELVSPGEINEELLDALVPSAPIDPVEYAKALEDLVFSIQDEDIREICNFVLFYKYKEEFAVYPAAKTVHHACRHGLLMHSVDMARMADTMSSLKPDSFNRDLLVAGALLHDVGKVLEFEVSPTTGLVVDYSNDGKLLGHSVLGAQEIEAAAGTVDARPEVTQLLKHMVLAHHGDPSCGAAKEPMTIEAELLHDLDLLDSRREIYEESLSNTPSGDHSTKIYALGHTIYNHQVAASAADQKGEV